MRLPDDLLRFIKDDPRGWAHGIAPCLLWSMASEILELRSRPISRETRKAPRSAAPQKIERPEIRF
jgi:hypothetical protein